MRAAVKLRAHRDLRAHRAPRAPQVCLAHGGWRVWLVLLGPWAHPANLGLRGNEVLMDVLESPEREGCQELQGLLGLRGPLGPQAFLASRENLEPQAHQQSQVRQGPRAVTDCMEPKVSRDSLGPLGRQGLRVPPSLPQEVTSALETERKLLGHRESLACLGQLGRKERWAPWACPAFLEMWVGLDQWAALGPKESQVLLVCRA